MKPVFLSFLALIVSAWGAEPVATYTRFCAGCGIWGVKTFLSHSEQFVVHGSSFSRQRSQIGNPDSLRWINVEPQILAVTAERSKKALLQELRAADHFHDKIHAIVLDLAPPEQAIQIVSEIFLDGFQYRLLVPGQVEHTRLIRGIVQTLLAEYANRGSKRCAELPLWLVEGMTWQVLSSTVPTYVMNESASAVDVLGYDRLSYTRAYLSTNTPMTVQELSFYNGVPADRERFEACAHMLAHELLKLNGGPELMTRFLRALPAALNWQTAFYNVYSSHFPEPLAFEKWWMLGWTELKNRTKQEVWPVDLSLTRLNALLLTPMEFRLNTNSVPQRQDVRPQEVLKRADFGVQKAIFSQKVQELYFASVNLPMEVLPLAQAYQETLEGYVQKRSVNQYQPGLKYDPEQRVQALVQAASHRLDELDRALEDLKQGRPVTVNTRLMARRPK